MNARERKVLHRVSGCAAPPHYTSDIHATGLQAGQGGSRLSEYTQLWGIVIRPNAFFLSGAGKVLWSGSCKLLEWLKETICIGPVIFRKQSCSIPWKGYPTPPRPPLPAQTRPPPREISTFPKLAWPAGNTACSAGRRWAGVSVVFVYWILGRWEGGAWSLLIRGMK